jgi:hypothetical protein
MRIYGRGADFCHSGRSENRSGGRKEEEANVEWREIGEERIGLGN